jgi:hypothetical protein
MEVELIISKDRIPYIIELLGNNKVTTFKYNIDSDRIVFILEDCIDVLHLFHAGVRCGHDERHKIYE